MHLFDRLPGTSFAPLVGKNGRRTWSLLVRLSENFFGPDAVPPYPDGYLHEQITKEIERFLLDAGWEEEGEELATPTNVQANLILSRLVDCGWLSEDRVGVRKFVAMRPVVSRFIEAIQQFAVEGPQLVSGNILLIHSGLKDVAKSPRANASAFVTAAQTCVRLINSLNATTLRTRDLMKELTQEQNTPVFVRRFFTEHIAEMYVRDFKELRTANHPLRLRFDIIELVTEIAETEPSRTQLLDGYREMPGNVPGQELAALERDIGRFHRLLDVEKFLDRMDGVMESASQRALAFLGYRLKASERIEEVIADTLDALSRADRLGVQPEGRLLSPPPVTSEGRLRMPTPAPAKPVRKAMRKREMTVHEQAMRLLRKAVVANRDATPVAMKRYVEANLEKGQSVTAADLPAGKVQDAVAFVVLMRLASLAKNNPTVAGGNPLLRRLGFTAAADPQGRRVETELFEAADFTVTREE